MPRLIFATCLWVACLFAGAFSAEAQARKTALVIGISSYDHGPALSNSVRDAQQVARDFQDIGFDTYLSRNATRAELLRVLAQFRLASRDADTTLIYFAGHGIQWRGSAYAVPKDAAFDTADRLLASSVPLATIIQSVSDKVRNKIILFDACREVPQIAALLKRDRPDPPQLDLQSAGLFVFYAAQPGAPAFDGGGSAGPFASAISRALSAEAFELTEFARAISLGVIQRTQGLQIPWSVSSLVTRIQLRDPGILAIRPVE